MSCNDGYADIVRSKDGPRFVNALGDILEAVCGKRYMFSMEFETVPEKDFSERDMVYGFAAFVGMMMEDYAEHSTFDEFGKVVLAAYDVLAERVPYAMDIPFDRISFAARHIASETLKRLECTTEKSH